MLYQRYKGQVEFWMVYIAEAHASDVWQLSVNERQGVVFANPSTIEERNSLATACVRDLGIEFPGVLDNFDNSTEYKYTAWPDRLYLIDLSGRVAFKSPPGPYGFKPALLEKAILEQVPPPAS